MPVELFAMSGAAFERWLFSLITIIAVGSMASYGLVRVDDKSVSAWCGIVDVALMGHIYNTTVAQTHKQCWNACKGQPQCNSVNFAQWNGQCELNNATHFVYSDDLSEGRGWVYTYTQIKSTIGCGGQTLMQPLINKETKVEHTWPQGTYGLPMPISGCPLDARVTWETGYRFHDTENTYSPRNAWSEILHINGTYASTDMQQYFCIKAVDRVCDYVGWPNGEYCIFQFGENCPSNMSSGSIFWDDEDSYNCNTVSGTVPSGVYTHDTLINYCCMTSGNASDPITLPTRSPFYLFAYTAQCQEVKGMKVTQEWFHWDDDDYYNSNYGVGNHPYDTGDWRGHTLHYCYYEDM